jgi:hypothetical protein
VKLGVDHDAPLPLGYQSALERAAVLRARGPMWTYPTVADAMSFYHGFERSPDWWRKELDGAVPKRDAARPQDFRKEAARAAG